MENLVIVWTIHAQLSYRLHTICDIPTATCCSNTQTVTVYKVTCDMLIIRRGMGCREMGEREGERP